MTQPDTRPELFEISATSHHLESLETALRAAAQSHGFGVLNVTDLDAKLRERGITYGHACRVYDICQPASALEALRRQPAVASLLPCRIAIYEREGELFVSMVRPTALIPRLAPELSALAAAVELTMIQILQSTAAASGPITLDSGSQSHPQT